MAVSISVSITQNSQNIANNTSNVTVKVTAKWTYGSYNLETETTSGSYCVIDGTKYSFTSPFNTGQTTSGSKVIFTKTLNIEHNADGSKSLTAKASYNTDVSSGTVTDSATKTLTTIPRATTPTLGAKSVYLEEDLKITLNRASSKFTHTLTYKYTYGGTTYSGTIGSGFGTSATWSVPKAIAGNLPDAESVTVTITCKTYSGGEAIGTKTATFTAKVPETSEYAPSITRETVSDANGHKDKYGDYVQSKSALSVFVGGYGGYGSQIKECNFVIDGVTYNATESIKHSGDYSTAEVTSKAIKTSGSAIINITIKDRRGRSYTESIVVYVIPYSRPAINLLQAYRCVSSTDSTRDDNGSYMCIVADTAVSPLNSKNGNAVVLQYKVAGTSDWKTATTSNLYSGQAKAIVQASTELTYDVRVVVTDDFNTAETAGAVSTVFTLMDFHSEGKGMAIGKVAEDEYKDHLDIGLPVRLAESNFVDILFTEGKGTITENKSKYIKPLGLVVIDLRIKLGSPTYEADTHHSLLTIDSAYKPSQLKALSAIQVVSDTSTAVYQAAMQTTGEVLLRLSKAITANSYVSVQGCYLL